MDSKLDAPEYSLEIEKKTRGGALLFHCRGGFTLVNYALLDGIYEQIKATQERKVVLDLAGVRMIDSVGVGTIAAIVKHTMAKDKEFVLVTNDVVDQVLSTASMTKVIRIVRSLEEALQ